jgi:hypothetical protein
MSMHFGIEAKAILFKNIQVNKEINHIIEEAFKMLDITGLVLFSAAKIPLFFNFVPQD